MSKRAASDVNLTGEDAAPPPCKRAKIESTAFQREFQIEQVPMDCLFEVFSTINFWHHNRIRATSRYFRDAHDCYLNHEFHKALNLFSKTRSDSVATEILNSIKKSTELYIKEGGYETIFCNCLLSILRRTYQTPFEFETGHLKGFLTSFFTKVDTCMENPNSPHAILVYIMTMLNLLKSFRDHKFNATDTIRSLKLNYLIPDIWLGTLHRRTKPKHEKCNAVLVILGLLLVGSRSRNAIKYVYEYEQEVFLCGTDAAGNPHGAQTEFEINVRGTLKMRRFFKQWLDRLSNAEIELPTRLHDEWFEFTIKTTCKSAVHWGCPSTKILRIIPRL